MSRVLQAVDSIHQVGVYCLALVPPNYLPKVSVFAQGQALFFTCWRVCPKFWTMWRNVICKSTLFWLMFESCWNFGTWLCWHSDIIYPPLNLVLVTQTPLGGIHLHETKKKYLDGTLHPANVLMCPHTCVVNLPKPREHHPGMCCGPLCKQETRDSRWLKLQSGRWRPLVAWNAGLTLFLEEELFSGMYEQINSMW